MFDDHAMTGRESAATPDTPAPSTRPRRAKPALPEGEARRTFRVPEVAAMTGLSAKRVRVEINLGRLAATKLGPRTTLISAAELDRWLAARTA